jgi:hypothetical protein
LQAPLILFSVDFTRNNGAIISGLVPFVVVELLRPIVQIEPDLTSRMRRKVNQIIPTENRMADIDLRRSDVGKVLSEFGRVHRGRERIDHAKSSRDHDPAKAVLRQLRLRKSESHLRIPLLMKLI